MCGYVRLVGCVFCFACFHSLFAPLCACLFVRMCVLCMHVNVFVCLVVCSFVCLWARLCVSLAICLCGCLCVCLFVCASVFDC